MNVWGTEHSVVFHAKESTLFEDRSETRFEICPISLGVAEGLNGVPPIPLKQVINSPKSVCGACAAFLLLGKTDQLPSTGTKA